MSGPTKVDLIMGTPVASSSGWIPLNIHQENFNVGFSIEHIGHAGAPVVNVEGTMQNVLVSGSVAAVSVFALASAITTETIGTNVAGQVTFPVAAIRISTLAGSGSGASTLRFTVLQTGKY